jgi:hypothetical protein
MTTRVTNGGEPLVAVVCKVPLLCEALTSTLAGIAETHSFPADLGDLDGLLRSLRPDAIVVDTPESAQGAASYARESHVPLVHVLFREEKLRVLADGSWSAPEEDGASPEAIRNLLVGGIFGRQPA